MLNGRFDGVTRRSYNSQFCVHINSDGEWENDWKLDNGDPTTEEPYHRSHRTEPT